MNIPNIGKNLSPRRQLREAVEAYAALTGLDARAVWFRLERMYFHKYGINLTDQRKAYAAKHGTLPTVALWIETSGIMERALALAMTMRPSC